MANREKLDEAEVLERLSDLPEWSLANAKLHREYKFSNFAYAFGFMATAAPLIERMNHHPEWSNVYGRVTVDLTTHDAGGITENDLKLAGVLETIARKLL